MSSSGELRDKCDTQGCENEPVVDDYGVCVCQECLTPKIELYLSRQAAREEERW